MPRDPHVALVARVASGRLILPWDRPAPGDQDRLLRQLRKPGGAADLLRSSPDVADEYGVPFAVYAARRLAGDASPELLREMVERMADVLNAAWLSPTAAHMLVEVAEALGATELREKATLHAGEAEQAEQLARQAPLLDDRGGEPVWRLFGSFPWLVAVTGRPADRERTLVAVRAPQVLASVKLPGQGKWILAGELAEARDVYERILREYAEQEVVVALARQRLSEDQPVESAKGDRVVWSGENVLHLGGSVSPDGRFVTYTDWFFSGNLMVHDLRSGETRPLTHLKDWGGDGIAGGSAFSPDGKFVAYTWSDYNHGREEVRVVSLHEPGVPKPRTILSREQNGVEPRDWSQDGGWLAVTIRRGDRTGQIGVLSLRDKSVKGLKTYGWRGPWRLLFSPDGKYLAYDLPASPDSAQRDLFIIAVDGSRDTRVVEHPAHDIVMDWSPDGTKLLFASDRTGTGGIWALPIADGKATGAPSLLKPDTGWVSSLGMTASGALHVYKDASTEALYLAPIDLKAGELTGPPVVESYGARRPDWTRDGKYVARVKELPSGARQLTVRSTESGEARHVRLELNYFDGVHWSADGRWLISGGRDLKGRSGIYKIDAETGTASFLRDGGPAIRVEVAPDGKSIYYPATTKGKSMLDADYVERDLASGEERLVSRPPGGTIPGRMELSPDGRFFAQVHVELNTKKKDPGDPSYLGAALLLIPSEGGTPKELLGFKKPEWLSAFDGMSWTPDSRAVVVLKKYGEDMQRPDRQELLLVPVDGGEPTKLNVDATGWGAIRLSPDGKQLAFHAGKQSEEIWMLENLIPERTAKK